MNCKNCNSERISYLLAHSKDLSVFEYAPLDIATDGYFPEIPGICGGDDLQIEVCLECGTIQSDTFPITDETIKEACASEFDDDNEDENCGYEYDPVSNLRHYNDTNIGVILKTLQDITFSDIQQLRKNILFKKTVCEKYFREWSSTIDPNGIGYFIAVFYNSDEDTIYFKRIISVKDNTILTNEITWDDFIKYESTS